MSEMFYPGFGSFGFWVSGFRFQISGSDIGDDVSGLRVQDER
jgi:hypothetical protein